MKLRSLIFAILAIFFAVSCDSGPKPYQRPDDEPAGNNDEETDADAVGSDDDDFPGEQGHPEAENNRIVIQLGWKQGFKSKADAESKDGVLVDLDLHLVKKSSIEAKIFQFDILDGLLGTKQRRVDNECPVALPECEAYWRHDDCSFGDNGILDEYTEETIAWNAKFFMDNYWGGGGSYEDPETIVMGPTADEKNNTTGENEPDGYPDAGIPDDQYLVVVTYGNCEQNFSDGHDRCDSNYNGEDGAGEVDARLTILVDGAEIPREGYDHYYTTSKDFKIKLNEWKVVAVIKWDSSMHGPDSKLKGNAIVSDTYLPEHGIDIDPVRYPVCVFDNTEATLVPVWDRLAYIDHITTPDPATDSVIGSCNDPEEPKNPYTGDKRKANCKHLPKNAEWNGASEIVQEWNGHEWTPTVEAAFSDEPGENECTFKCKENYSWDGSSCAADQMRVPCEGTLPANAVLNDNDSEGYYTQTWTGEAGGWQPQNKRLTYSDTPGECRFNCQGSYSWNGIACEPSPDMLPDCSPESGTPCKDPVMGLIWSEKGSATYDNATAICYNLNYAGYGGFADGWHLPTISELRTLINGCPGTILPGGTCEVREDNDAICLTKEEYDCQGESCYSCTGDPDGGYSKFGETGWFWSSSVYADDQNSAWGVGFMGADVYSNAKSETNFARCVRSICAIDHFWNGSSCQSNTRTANCQPKPENTEWNDGGRGGTFTQTYDIWTGEWGPASRNTIYSSNIGECHYKCAENYLWNYNNKCEYYTEVLPECSESSGTPCYDPSSGLTWSEQDAVAMLWNDAVEHCSGYQEGNLNGWSLPTISELRTLIKNCDSTVTGGSCSVTGSCLASTCQDESCFSCEYQDDGRYSKLGDNTWLWSSSNLSNNPEYEAWLVVFDQGSIGWDSKSGSPHNVRCVKR